MVTLIKLNVLTDDPELPKELRDGIDRVMQALMKDDPEGSDHASMHIEWKETVHGRDYMRNLVGRTTERVRPVPVVLPPTVRHAARAVAAARKRKK